LDPQRHRRGLRRRLAAMVYADQEARFEVRRMIPVASLDEAGALAPLLRIAIWAEDNRRPAPQPGD
jgi:hypothetical protein